MRDALGLLLAFGFGSIPFGLLMVKLVKGQDVRNVGSGNIGATNVSRAAGKSAGVLVLLLDALKGSAGLWVGKALTEADPQGWVWAGMAVAPMAGHIFTPWLRFRGGKGVATALGVLAVFNIWMLAAAVGGFLLGTLLTRMISAGSMSGALAVGIGSLILFGWAPPAGGMIACATLVLIRHESNFRRILKGDEPKFWGARSSEETKR